MSSLLSVTTPLGFLAAKGACLLCTTIAENAAMMLELMGLHPAKFRPGIPNLVYQYSIYVNYSSDRLKELNPEIDQEDWQQRPLAAESRPSDPAERPVGAARSEESQPEMEEVPSFEETPELLLLGELRRQLFLLKRAIEAIQAPLQMALRRNSKGGTAGTAPPNQAAAAKVDAARISASEIVDALQQWLEAHAVEVSAAMDGSSDSWQLPLDETRSLLASHELSTDWSQRCRQAAGKLFQRSNQVLERTKKLKAQQKKLAFWQMFLIDSKVSTGDSCATAGASLAVSFGSRSGDTRDFRALTDTKVNPKLFRVKMMKPLDLHSQGVGITRTAMQIQSKLVDSGAKKIYHFAGKILLCSVAA
eukprot:s7_g35.t1